MAMMSMNKSYFWSYDYRQGWNYTRFQSFWNDFFRDDEGMKYVEFSFLTLFAVISLLLNLYLLVLLCMRKHLRLNQSKYIIGIMLCTVVWLPSVFLIAATRLTHGWTFGDFSCKLTIFTTVNTSFVKIVFMAIISIGRYLKVVRGKLVKRKTSISIISLSVLVVSSTTAYMSIPNTFTQEINYHNASFHICTVVFQYHEKIRISLTFMITIFTVYFILPAIIICICYSRIMSVIKNSVRSINRHKIIHGSYINYGQQRKTLILILIAVLFVVMWISLFSCVIALTLDQVLQNYKLSSRLLIMSINISLINTIIEPLLYTLTARAVRQNFLPRSIKVKRRRTSITES